MLKINNLKRKLAVTALVAACVLMLYAFDVPCVILTITGHKCPSCGMTRAFMAALRLDFKTAFMYNRMFWSLPVLYWCFLKDGSPFKDKRANAVLYVVIAILFAINVMFC